MLSKNFTKDELNTTIKEAVRDSIKELKASTYPVYYTPDELIPEELHQLYSNNIPSQINYHTELITTQDVMRILNISRRQVQYLRDKGDLPYFKNNRTVRYHIHDVNRLFNREKRKTEREN